MTNTPDARRKRFVQQLVFLYGDYCDALIQAEKDGKGRYTDLDFEDFGNFMRFLRNNYL